MGTVPALRVCHLASGDLWAGAEVQLATLLSGLVRCDDIEPGVILFNDGVLADRIRKLDIPLWVIEESRHNSLSLLRQTRRLLENERFSVLHTHRYKENILGAAAARMAGVSACVCTIHGLAEPFSGIKQLKARLYRGMNHWVYRHWMNRIIAVSHDIERRLAGRFGSEKLVTIHNGIDLTRLDRIQPLSADRERLGIAEDSVVIGTAGRMMPVKAYDVLLRAARKVVDQAPNVRVVLVGDGPELPALKKLAGELDLDRNVVFHEFTPRVAELMTLFDVFVLSSLTEGVSISLLEAMALGKPVVVTDVGGNPEVAVDGETGFLVPSGKPEALADACLRLVREPELRQAMGRAGRKRVEVQFSNERTVDAVDRLYHQVVEGR